jgi:tetratricopeptide (TPR) repeat protein
MKSSALTRIANLWLIVGFVASVGFVGIATADNLASSRETSEENWASKATSACMPRPASGPAYENWRKSALAYNNALLAQKLNDNDRAAAHFDIAIKLYPNNALAHLARARIYKAAGGDDRAIDEYSQAIKAAPSCFIAFNDRCYARARKDDLQAALADCNEALKLVPGHAEFFDSRGFVYLKMGDLDKAIADYDAALQINADHPHARFGRGKARLLKGDEPRGTFDITVAKRIKPDIADEMSRYGLK